MAIRPILCSRNDDVTTAVKKTLQYRENMFDQRLEEIWTGFIIDEFPHESFLLNRVRYDQDRVMVEIEMAYDIVMGYKGDIFREMETYLWGIHNRLKPFFLEVLWRDRITVGQETWRVTLRFLDSDVFEMFSQLVDIESRKDLAGLRLKDDSGKMFQFANMILNPLFS